MKNSKNITIRVNPETFEKMSPECVKSCVTRRIANAKHNSNRTVANAVFVFITALLLMFVFAFSAVLPKEEEEVVYEPVAPVRVITVRETAMKTWYISDEDKAAVTTVVMSVARGESTLAQQAVAQAIRNTCETFGMTVSEVIADFAWPATYEGEIPASVTDAVESVIDGNPAVNETIHYAYNPACQDGKWHETMTYVCQIGNLRFFK